MILTPGGGGHEASQKKLSQRNFAHRKSQMDCFGTEPVPPRLESGY